jgi:hypothetical protein
MPKNGKKKLIPYNAKKIHKRNPFHKSQIFPHFIKIKINAIDNKKPQNNTQKKYIKSQNNTQIIN